MDEPPLLSSAFFASTTRPYRDLIFRRIFISLVALTFALGSLFIGVCIRQHAVQVFSDGDGWLDVASHCGLEHSSPPISYQAKDKLPHGMTVFYILISSAGLIFSAIAAAALLALLALTLLQVAPLTVVWLSLGSQIAAPLILALFASEMGMTNLSFFLLILAATIAISCYVNSDSIGIVARLCGVAAACLGANPGLLLMLLTIKICLLIFTMVIGIFSLAAFVSGSAVPNPLIALVDGHSCFGMGKNHVPCCIWISDPFVPYYLTLSSLTLIWVTLVAFEIKVFTVGGTVSQWYFAPIGHMPQNACFTSLSHAVGPSLGSLSLASLVLAAISYARILLNRFRQERDGGRGVFPSLVYCCSSCVLELLKNLSKFATIYISMSGCSFLTSSMEVIDLLSRNALPLYTLWWLPPLILRSPCYLTSALMGFASYHVSIALWGHSRPSGQENIIHVLAQSVSFLTGVAVWSTLSFLAGALLDVIDSVFVCYAIDRDVGACSSQQVHEVFSQIPGCQPEGGYSSAGPYAPFPPGPLARQSSLSGALNSGFYYPPLVNHTPSDHQNAAPQAYSSRGLGSEWSSAPLSPMARPGYDTRSLMYSSPFQQQPYQGAGVTRMARPYAPSPLIYSPSMDPSSLAALSAAANLPAAPPYAVISSIPLQLSPEPILSSHTSQQSL